MIDMLDFYRDARDQLVEQTFHAVYGSPMCRPHAESPRMTDRPGRGPGCCPRSRRRSTQETHRLRGRIAEGGPLEAAARVLVYIGEARRRIEERTFDALRKLLLAHPEVSPVDFKAALREQWAILAVDERAAIAALPQLLPADAAARHAFSAAISAIASAAGDLNADAQRRLNEVKQLLEIDLPQSSAKRGKRPIAAQ